MNLTSRRVLTANPVRHLVDLLGWDGDRIRKVLKDAARLKKAHAKGKNKPLLQGRVLALIFEKPSAAHARQLPGGHGAAGRRGHFLDARRVRAGQP